MKCNQIDSDNLCCVYLGDHILNCKPFFKYLGIYLDQPLSFKEHVTRLVNRDFKIVHDGRLGRLDEYQSCHPKSSRHLTVMLLGRYVFVGFLVVESTVKTVRIHPYLFTLF